MKSTIKKALCSAKSVMTFNIMWTIWSPEITSKAIATGKGTRRLRVMSLMTLLRNKYIKK